MEMIVSSARSVGRISNVKIAHASCDGKIDYYVVNATSEKLKYNNIKEYDEKDKYGRTDWWYLTWECMLRDDNGNYVHKYYEISYEEIKGIEKFSNLTSEETKYALSIGYDIFLRMVAILNNFYNIDSEIDPDMNDTAIFLTKMFTNYNPKSDSSYDYEDLINNYKEINKTLKKLDSSNSNEGNKKFVVYNLNKKYNHDPDFHFEIRIDEKYVTMGYIKNNEWYFSTKYNYKECSEAQHITNLKPVFDNEP